MTVRPQNPQRPAVADDATRAVDPVGGEPRMKKRAAVEVSSRLEERPLGGLRKSDGDGSMGWLNILVMSLRPWTFSCRVTERILFVQYAVIGFTSLHPSMRRGAAKR